MYNSFSSSWSRVLAYGVCAALVIGTLFLYHVSIREAGGHEVPTDDGSVLDLYHQQVVGFQRGQLSLGLEPKPELLALPDPYDSARNAEWKLGDMSLYQGKYYLYFGIAPVVTLMWPWVALGGGPMNTGTAVQVFASIGFIGLCLLMLSVRRRAFPDLSPWWLVPAVLIMGYATRIAGVMIRPQFWELPIVSSFCFSTLALLALWQSLRARRPLFWLAAAGVSYGLVMASRPTHFFFILVFVPFVLALRRSRGVAWKGIVMALVVGVGPMAAGLAGFNYARFGKITEFGQSYQLVGNREIEHHRFSPAYIPINLRIYFTERPQFEARFPFFRQLKPSAGHPNYIVDEAVCGYFWLFPTSLLLLGLFLAGSRTTTEFRVLAGAAGLWLTATLGVMLNFFSALSRYFVDFTPALALLSGLGAILIAARLPKGWPRLVGWLGIVTLSVLSTLGGILLRFDGYDRFLERVNPPFFNRVACFAEALCAPVSGVTPPISSASGVLRLHVVVPSQEGHSWPLVSTGRRGAGDLIGLVNEGGGRYRIFFDHWGSALLQSGPLRLEPGVVHLIDVRLPSFEATSFGAAATGVLEVRVNGAVVLTSRVTVWPFLPGEILLGANQAGFTTCTNRFPGEIRDFGWLQAP